jgi:hypothetical protein
MRSPEKYGPKAWSDELLNKIAENKEENHSEEVTQETVDRWKVALESSEATDSVVIREILK